MKGLIKSTTAALALLTLASCADDLGTSSWFGADQQKGVYVEVEDMTNPVTTRAAYDPANKNQLYWQVKDELRILDATMQKYDKYQFTKDNLFANIKTSSNIEEPVYALFGDIVSHGWDYESDGVTADFNIPSNWTWAEATVGEDEVEAYQSMLPMWGEAKADEEYGIKATLRYLTGILKVNLANVPGNASSIKVEAYKDLSGTTPANLTGIFRAQIATGGKDNKKAQLTEIKDNPYGNSIYVDVSEASREKTVLYIPIVPGTYKLLRIGYWDGKTVDGTGAPVYNNLKSFKNAKFTRGAVASATIKEFATGGESLESLSKIIALKADGSDDIVITTTNTTEATTSDNNLFVPMTDNNITVNLKKLAKATSEGSTTIYIDDNGDGFAKTFTLNLLDVDGTNKVNTINLQLPDADVCLIGKLDDITVTGAAKSLTIGDATKAADATTLNNLTPDADMGDIIINGTVKSALNIPNNANTTTITINGIFTPALDLSGWEDETDSKRVISVELGNKAQVTGKITAKCDITVPYLDKDNFATVGDIETTGDVTVNGQATNVKSTEGDVEITGKVTGNVEASKGDVTVARTTEGVAIGGKLTFKGLNPTLTLTGGYIAQLDSKNLTASATPATDGLTIANTEVCQTAIASVVSGSKIKAYTSTWAGLTIGATDETNASTLQSDYAKGNIYTATMLASYTPNLDGKLYANINLNSKAFAPLATLTADNGFDGNGKTIKNLVITHKAESGKTVAGLFTNINKNVKNLTLENVTTSLTYTAKTSSTAAINHTALGALAGTAGAALTITNVQVKGISSLESDGAYVGGLIGSASAAVTFTGFADAVDATVKVQDYSQVALSSITGSNYLGGLIGSSSAAVTITDYAVVLPENGFAVNSTAPATVGKTDKTFGTIGMYIGSITSNVAVSIGSSATEKGLLATTDRIAGNRKALGFMNNYTITGTGDEVQQFFFFGGTPMIGYNKISETSNLKVGNTAVLGVSGTLGDFTGDNYKDGKTKNYTNLYVTTNTEWE